MRLEYFYLCKICFRFKNYYHSQQFYGNISCGAKSLHLLATLYKQANTTKLCGWRVLRTRCSTEEGAVGTFVRLDVTVGVPHSHVFLQLTDAAGGVAT